MNKHSIAILLRGVCPILGVDAEQALQAARWAPDTNLAADLNVTGSDFISLWDTIIELAGDRSDPLFLGRAMANGPVFPIFLAFSTAPHLREALRRLARYKSLFGPVAIGIKTHAGGLRMVIAANEPSLNLPESLTVPIGIFVVEKARSQTARRIIPTSMYLPPRVMDVDIARSYFGTTIRPSKQVIIHFSSADSRTPFVSRNDELWLEIEQDLERQLADSMEGFQFHRQIEAAIRRALNVGPVRVDAICEELRMSRSTMQRKLKEEGYSYQAILNEIRQELAIRYLTKSLLMPSRIASLVGFMDSKSFHRAFKSWTGMTPEQYRSENSSDRLPAITKVPSAR